jgi:hypothetical protein
MVYFDNCLLEVRKKTRRKKIKFKGADKMDFIEGWRNLEGG